VVAVLGRKGGTLPELKVIADTSFLMIPGLYRVDILLELDRLLERSYKLVVPKPTVDELRRLEQRGNAEERAAARIGLAMVGRMEVVEAAGPADEAILELAGKGDCAVATTDASLRRRLREKGIPVIYLCHRSHLAMDGWTG
jgi:rRNA-processing protein FCF1